MAAAVASAVSGSGPRPSRLTLPTGREVVLGWCEVGREDAASLWPAEREALARCRLDKRRHELIAGRVAAHRALALLAPGAHAEVLARPGGQDEGRPFFPSAPDVALSISHSEGLAVAAVARGGALGVDLEQRVEAGGAFLEEAFAPGEHEGYAAPCAGRVEPVTAAWAMKEAVLKVWGVGLRAPLQRVAVRPVLLSASGEALSLRLTLEAEGLPPELGVPPAVLTGLLLAGEHGRVLALAAPA
ncbi:4'-phosphopantetheinyl transferase family protein [Archangium lipolyticum]|uniref:4'-phosphopantetheinyl transferase family protein n=1 Tax=Archangium lipolyticum TaxID=2970465 RepID=UPI00214A61B2|nr:4'-phosphopantetheinyl transferase superfamily protein [Archangium lipolyticum]